MTVRAPIGSLRGRRGWWPQISHPGVCGTEIAPYLVAALPAVRHTWIPQGAHTSALHVDYHHCLQYYSIQYTYEHLARFPNTLTHTHRTLANTAVLDGVEYSARVWPESLDGTALLYVAV